MKWDFHCPVWQWGDGMCTALAALVHLHWWDKKRMLYAWHNKNKTGAQWALLTLVMNWFWTNGTVNGDQQPPTTSLYQRAIGVKKTRGYTKITQNFRSCCLVSCMTSILLHTQYSHCLYPPDCACIAPFATVSVRNLFLSLTCLISFFPKRYWRILVFVDEAKKQTIFKWHMFYAEKPISRYI